LWLVMEAWNAHRIMMWKHLERDTLKNENESERMYSGFKGNTLWGREMNVAGSSSCPIRGDFEPRDIRTGRLDCISLLIWCNLPYTLTLCLSIKHTI
jgi:hypothetical protein